MSKEHQLKVSINTAVEGKYTGENWGWYNAQFKAVDTTAHGLAVAIWKGHSFAPVYCENRRRKENFEQAGHIAFDFDAGDDRSSLDTLCNDGFYMCYGAFCYSTPSSTAEHPKSRMVYIFERPITDLERYESLYHAILKIRYTHSPLADKSTKDGARLFFGSKKCEVRGNWELLGDDDIDGMIEMWKEAMEHENKRDNSRVLVIPPSTGGKRFEKVLQGVLLNITDAADGEKHHKLTQNAFAIGGYVTGGYIPKHEAEAALLAAVGRMKNVRDLGAAERTALDSMQAGMKSPLILEQQANFVLDEV